MKCGHCGAADTGGTAVCAHCGAAVAGPRPQPPPSRAGVYLMGEHGWTEISAGTAGRRAGPGRLARRYQVAGGLGLAAFVAVIWVIGMAALAPPSTGRLTIGQLQPGDCVTGADLRLGGGGSWPYQVTAVSCTRMHLAEVFFAGNGWPGSSTVYPGDNAIANQGWARCLTAFRAYDGTGYANSALAIDYVVPSAGADWASGDRLLVCLAYTPRVPVNYSVRGRDL